MTQAVGVVSVFVSGHDLIKALSEERQRVVSHSFVISRIAEELDQVTRQMMPLVKGTQRQQPGVTGDLATGKITVNGTMLVEGEAEL